MNTPTTPSLSITWDQPSFILPLFCLCPLLSASDSLAIAIAMAAMVAWLTTASTLILLTSRSLIPNQLKEFAALIFCAALIAITEMVIHAANIDLYKKMGMFLPLSVIACLLMNRNEMLGSAPRNQLKHLLKINAGFTFAAIVLGTGREIVGRGTLLGDLSLIFHMDTPWMEMRFFPADMGFVMGVLAPGAFIGFGIGVALYNWLWLHRPSKD